MSAEDQSGVSSGISERQRRIVSSLGEEVADQLLAVQPIGTVLVPYDGADALYAPRTVVIPTGPRADLLP